MNLRNGLRAWIGVVGLVALSLECQAEPKAAKTPDPYAFSTRVYRFPSDELASGFVSKDKGSLHAPPLPPASASSGELEAFVKRSHDVVKEYLAQQGIVLPKGSLACYDPATETLALRGMTVVHELVEFFASNSLLNRVPHHLNWSLEVVEAPTAAVRAAMKEARGKSDHAAVLEHLLPQGWMAVTMRGETKPGVEISARQGSEMGVPVEYETDSRQHVQSAKTSHQAGTEFRMNPTVGADDRTIDLVLQLTHHYAPPTPRWEAQTTGTDKVIEARWLDYPEASVSTSITITDGTVHLLGVWTLEGAAEPTRSTAMQAAFLRVALVRLQPLEDRRVEQLLKAHGEAVEPTPKAVRPVADPSLPPGMIIRRFHIAPDFLTAEKAGDSAAPAAPADPFSSSKPKNEPRFMRHVTAEDILRSAGIPFPEGSSANFLPTTSELVVRNTPANMDLIESYVEASCAFTPKIVSLTLQVVQGDAALIRRLSQETFTLPDHAAAWQAVETAAAQGKARIVRALVLDAKPGVEAAVDNVIQYARGEGLDLNSSADSAKAEKGGTAPVARATIVNASAEPNLRTAAETVPVGLRFKVNPTVGADSRTIDLVYSIDYDFAPPTLLLEKDPAPERTQRLVVPMTDFHRTSTGSNTTLLSGATRMLSVWKPSGTPELDGDVLQAAFLHAEVIRVEPPK